MLLKLIGKGVSREDAYKMVQTPAMQVWADAQKNFKSELLNSKEISEYLSKEEIEDIFDTKQMLKNVDNIFNRTINLG